MQSWLSLFNDVLSSHRAIADIPEDTYLVLFVCCVVKERWFGVCTLLVDYDE
jgi:hypothetical protein